MNRRHFSRASRAPPTVTGVNEETLEEELLKAVNRTGIGPEGLGGKVTAMAVHVETHPCHIASLPVAVNINCHAARHKTIIL